MEPAYDVGGDVFDFTLSETGASLAIFDAMGHGLGAGLLAAGAMSAYRSARRDGRNVYAQAQAIDEVLVAAFGDGGFVTGVLAELDFATGRLRYVAAGHPMPLLLRKGKVVKSLGGGRRVPFGVEGTLRSVGEERLEPGDWLVLYTDGVTEARDPSGGFFGHDRLVDFLERAASTDQPPPETVRRLMHAVLAHQQGVLQDDATVLLAQWADTHLDTWASVPR